MWGSCDPLLEFWDPLISRGRIKLETSNLAQRCMAVSNNEKNAKLGQKGSRGGHVTHFWNFGTTLIYPERLKLEISNLAQKWMAVSNNEKNAKLGQKGSCGGHVTHFWNFGIL